jgi:hypothetical protein
VDIETSMFGCLMLRCPGWTDATRLSFFFFKKRKEGRPDVCKLPSFLQGASILGRTFFFLSKSN